MGIKTVILHVGMHKTGSSSIQETIYNNRALIEEKGYLYINNWGDNQSVVICNLFMADPTNYYANQASGRTTIEEINKFNEINFKSFIEVCETTQVDKLLISAEDFSRLNEEELIQAKEFFVKKLGQVDFRVIFYTREPVSYMVSVIQQIYLDMGNELERIEQLLGDTENAFRFAIKRFFDVFDCTDKLHNSLEIYSFEEIFKTHKGPVEHFLSLLGFEEDEILKFGIYKANQARCGEVVDFILFIEEKVPLYINTNGFKEFNPLRAAYDLEPLVSIKGSKFDVPYEQKVRHQQITKDDCIWLKDNIGIDYTNITIKDKEILYAYSEDTLYEFMQAFPRLTNRIKGLFLEFFKKKYKETKDVKFKKLFNIDSEPYKLFRFATQFEKLIDSNDKIAGDMKRFGTKEVFPKNYSQLFIDCGNGFCEQDSFVFTFKDNNFIHIQLEFKDSQKFKLLRVDPSIYHCVALFEKIVINDKEANYQICGGNHIDIGQKVCAFFQEDPQINIKSKEYIKSIKIDMLIDFGTFPFAFCINTFNLFNPDRAVRTKNSVIITQACVPTPEATKERSYTRNLEVFSDENKRVLIYEQKLQQMRVVLLKHEEIIQMKDEKIKLYSQTLDELKKRNMEQHEILRTLITQKAELIKTLQDILNSYSWRFTKIFRFIFKHVPINKNR